MSLKWWIILLVIIGVFLYFYRPDIYISVKEWFCGLVEFC